MSKSGFTLVEILIVLAVLAILGAVVTPNVLGFVSRGKERAYTVDKRLLQGTVDAYRSETRQEEGSSWPTLTGQIGIPDEGGLANYQCDGSDSTELCSWIDIKLLADSNYIAGSGSVSSANRKFNTTATNRPFGHYGWYIDDRGLVQSDPDFSLTIGYP